MKEIKKKKQDSLQFREQGVVGNSNTNGQARSGQEARKPSNPWWKRAINATRLLRFGDEEIDKKYYEDEYLRVMQMLSYQMYLGALISVVLAIMAFVASEYPLLLGVTAAVLIIPMLTLTLAKKFPYKVNWLLSGNNIAWCILIGVVYIWRDGSLVQKCGQSGYYQSSSVTDTTQASCSHIFILGGGFYALHVALLIGTNIFMNITTFAVINAVYVLSILPSIPYLVCFIIVPSVVVGMTGYAKEKNTRLYYELINKYYIWYHIANNVLPQKIIVTKAATPNATATPREGAYQFVKANRRARKEFGINSTEQLQQFISQVELKQETHQSVPAYPDDNATQNLAAGGRMDSLHSKSLGVISQFSKKSFTSRQSQLQGISGISGNRPQSRLIPLDLLMKREIRRQNSNYDGNNQQNQVDQQSSNINNLPGMHYISHSPANNDNKQPQQFAGTPNNNNNTTFQDQGAMFMRNKKRSLFQAEDPGLQSMANPSQKQRSNNPTLSKTPQSQNIQQQPQQQNIYPPITPSQQQTPQLRQQNTPNNNNNNTNNGFQQPIVIPSKKSASKKPRIQKFQGNIKLPDEDKKSQSISLICYNCDYQQYQLLVFDDDQGVTREQILDEQIVIYKTFSMNFAHIVQSDLSMLQFYLQQMRQNQAPQKKLITDCLYDAFYVNSSVNTRINNFLEFYNLENQNLELNPRQFSLKKLMKDVASYFEFRLKSNQVTLILSNECPPQLDTLYNDEKRLRHILFFLLSECISNTQMGQIVISASSGAAELGDQGETALQGTIKITIRDNSGRKYKPDRLSNYFFATTNLNKIIRNKTQTYQDIESSICKELLRLIGPQGNIFYMSEERNNSNKVSFYVYSDLLMQENLAVNIAGANDQILDADYQDDGLQQQIQNSDDDDEDEDGTYKNNNHRTPQEVIQEKGDNQQQNNNPSSIYLYHNQDSRPLNQQLQQAIALKQQQQQIQQQQQQQIQYQQTTSSQQPGSGAVFSSTNYQLQPQNQTMILQQQLLQQQQIQLQQQVHLQQQQALLSQNSSQDKLGLLSGNNNQSMSNSQLGLQVIQQQVITNNNTPRNFSSGTTLQPSSLIHSEKNSNLQIEKMTKSEIEKLQNKKEIDRMLNNIPQEKSKEKIGSNFSQKNSKNDIDIIMSNKNSNNNNNGQQQFFTQPERNQVKGDIDHDHSHHRQSSLQKSTSQLFEESDKVNDENPISDVFVKELSQTSVMFKRELSKRLTLKTTNLFKNSVEDIDFGHSILNNKQGLALIKHQQQSNNNNIINLTESSNNMIISNHNFSSASMIPQVGGHNNIPLNSATNKTSVLSLI